MAVSRCLLAEQLPPDRQRFAMKRLGATVEALILIDAPELHQRDGDVRVLAAEQPAPHVQRQFEARPRARVVAHLRQQNAEVVQALGHP